MTILIDAAQRQGAEPVLLTPVNRRRFDPEGKLVPTHGDYPDAVRTLARQRGVKLIDLERASARLFERLGAEGTKRVFCCVPRGHYNYPDGSEDNSHLCEDGAVLIACCVANALSGGSEGGRTGKNCAGAAESLLALLNGEDAAC